MSRRDYPTLGEFAGFFGCILLTSFLVGVAQAHWRELARFYAAEPVLFAVMVAGLIALAVAIALYLWDAAKAGVSDPHKYCADWGKEGER